MPLLSVLKRGIAKAYDAPVSAGRWLTKQWPFWILASGVVVGILWFVPIWQASTFTDQGERFRAENDARRTLAQIVGGFGLLLGLYFTYRRISATEDRQITDRYTEAIKQLGDGKLEIRLGGIYSLERIARDSKKDHGPIMEVLTAFVRENARYDESAKESATQERPRADIQTILTVIGRRELAHEKAEYSLDLVGTQLTRALLVGAHLERVILFQTHLERANLWRAHLEGARLLQTHLEGANLSEAHLEGADLWQAERLTKKQIQEAHIDENTKLRREHQSPGLPQDGQQAG